MCQEWILLDPFNTDNVASETVAAVIALSSHQLSATFRAFHGTEVFPLALKLEGRKEEEEQKKKPLQDSLQWCSKESPGLNDKI